MPVSRLDSKHFHPDCHDSQQIVATLHFVAVGQPIMAARPEIGLMFLIDERTDVIDRTNFEVLVIEAEDL